MRRQALLTLLAAGMLVLAGCAGSTGPGGGTPTAGDGTDGTDGGVGGTATGTVEFYVSDQPAVIEDFRHLNVTISRIGFEPAGDVEDGDATATVTPTAGTATGTATTAGTATETPTAGTATATGTVETATETATATPTATPAPTATEDDDAEDEEDEEKSGWITREVDSRTVDLTRLRGDNATLVGTPRLPAGEYTKVFVYVDTIEATLQDGTSVNVKLPSQKLQLNKGFTLEPNGTVSFVYDISVVKAGNSGKYILKPVISESGPDAAIEEVGDERDDEDDEAEDDEETESEDESEDDEETESEAEAETESDPEDESGGPPETPPGN